MKPEVLELDALRIVKIKNFLDPSDRDRLFNTLCSEPEAFRPPNGQEDSTGRMLTIDDNGIFDTESPTLLSAAGVINERLSDNLTTFAELLGIDAHSPSKLRLSIIHGLDGHYTDLHQDTVNDNMKLTALLYLLKNTTSFTGGYLQVFPSMKNEESRTHLAEEKFIDVSPDDNTLVVFQSEWFHHVTEVVTDSNAFEDGRFNVTVFI